MTIVIIAVGSALVWIVWGAAEDAALWPSVLANVGIVVLALLRRAVVRRSRR